MQVAVNVTSKAIQVKAGQPERSVNGLCSVNDAF